MSDYTPTPEAVEAAARALWASWNPNGPAWGATSEEYREQARSEARAALTAAGPLIAAEALGEVSALAHLCGHGFVLCARCDFIPDSWKPAALDAWRTS